MTEGQMIKALYDDMQSMKGDMQSMKGDMESMKDDIKSLKNDVRGLQLTLENETNRNIRIIAEGHLELNRKLDEALKVESEKEMMHLRVNVLENDMRKVKEKVGIA